MTLRCAGVRYVCVLATLLLSAVVYAADNAWLVGKWELTYDPDGARKDYVEFLENGDAYSSGPLGKQAGFYIVSDNSVKAVFTFREKDFIMTFHVSDNRDELRIVTSHTGRESIYKRIQP